MKALADVKRSILGLAVVRTKIGGRNWATGRVEDPYLKTKLLLGGEHGCVNLVRWKTLDELCEAVAHNEVELVRVRRKFYWDGGDPRDALIVRVAFQYPLPARGEQRKCSGGWNDKTFTETGCQRPAIGRFVSTDPQTLKKRHVWLCGRCTERNV